MRLLLHYVVVARSVSATMVDVGATRCFFVDMVYCCPPTAKGKRDDRTSQDGEDIGIDCSTINNPFRGIKCRHALDLDRLSS